MSRQLTFSVVADGGTDRVLVPIIQWAIHRLDPQVEILEPEFEKRTGSVKEFLSAYHPDVMLVFLHRDAENRSLEQRLVEFDNSKASDIVPVVPVIPVRMSEAWLLVHGPAIARAAGASSSVVEIPKTSVIEDISNPKRHLDNLILEAAGNPSGRRRKTFKRSMVNRRVSVASFIADFSPLEDLRAFRSFQQSLHRNYPYQKEIG